MVEQFKICPVHELSLRLIVLVRFCLLEQYLPDGSDHPFAQKMLQHFQNLQTPLKNVKTYPKLNDQRQRFLKCNWPTVTIRSLWALWSDHSFLSSLQKSQLYAIEPFDEWEEFVLFASHYFLLVASKESEYDTDLVGTPSSTIEANVTSLELRCSSSKQACEHRRFGAASTFSTKTFGLYGGMGTKVRLDTTAFYELEGTAPSNEPGIPPEAGARACHTMTSLTNGGCLLTGGRTSPENPLQDCWHYKTKTWKKVDDLPLPLFRHSASSVDLGNGTEAVLVYGGRSNRGCLPNEWFLWRESKGWTNVPVSGQSFKPRFGASMISTAPSLGILLGGMTEDGLICDETYIWELSSQKVGSCIELEICLQPVSVQGPASASLPRFGACITNSSIGLLLVGGVANSFLSRENEILRLRNDLDCIKVTPVKWDFAGQRPLLVGHDVCTLHKCTIIIGGGAVCFSFGAFWNRFLYTLQENNSSDTPSWVCRDNGGLKENDQSQNQDIALATQRSGCFDKISAKISPISRFSVTSASGFEHLVREAKPVVMKGLDIGRCTEEWTLEALEAKIGSDRKVNPFKLPLLTLLRRLDCCT